MAVVNRSDLRDNLSWQNNIPGVFFAGDVNWDNEPGNDNVIAGQCEKQDDWGACFPRATEFSYRDPSHDEKDPYYQDMEIATSGRVALLSPAGFVSGEPSRYHEPIQATVKTWANWPDKLTMKFETKLFDESEEPIEKVNANFHENRSQRIFYRVFDYGWLIKIEKENNDSYYYINEEEKCKQEGAHRVPYGFGVSFARIKICNQETVMCKVSIMRDIDWNFRELLSWQVQTLDMGGPIERIKTIAAIIMIPMTFNFFVFKNWTKCIPISIGIEKMGIDHFGGWFSEYGGLNLPPLTKAVRKLSVAQQVKKGFEALKNSLSDFLIEKDVSLHGETDRFMDDVKRGWDEALSSTTSNYMIVSWERVDPASILKHAKNTWSHYMDGDNPILKCSTKQFDYYDTDMKCTPGLGPVKNPTLPIATFEGREIYYLQRGYCGALLPWGRDEDAIITLGNRVTAHLKKNPINQMQRLQAAPRGVRFRTQSGNSEDNLYHIFGKIKDADPSKQCIGAKIDYSKCKPEGECKIHPGRMMCMHITCFPKEIRERIMEREPWNINNMSGEYLAYDECSNEAKIARKKWMATWREINDKEIEIHPFDL